MVAVALGYFGCPWGVAVRSKLPLPLQEDAPGRRTEEYKGSVRVPNNADAVTTVAVNPKSRPTASERGDHLPGRPPAPRSSELRDSASALDPTVGPRTCSPTPQPRCPPPRTPPPPPTLTPQNSLNTRTGSSCGSWVCHCGRCRESTVDPADEAPSRGAQGRLRLVPQDGACPIFET